MLDCKIDLTYNLENKFKGKGAFKIEIVDDVIVSAKSRFMNRNGSEVRVQIELHCLKVTPD